MKIETRVPAICKVLEIIEARVRFNIALQKRIATADDTYIYRYFYNYSAATRSSFEQLANDHAATKLCINDCRSLYIDNIQSDINNLNNFVQLLKSALLEITNLLPVLMHIERKLSHEQLDAQDELREMAKRKKELIKLAKTEIKQSAVSSNASKKQLKKSSIAAAKAVTKTENTYSSFSDKTELFVYKEVKFLLNAHEVLTDEEYDFIDKYTDVSTIYADGDNPLPLYFFRLNDNFNKLVSKNFKAFSDLHKKIQACKLQIPNFYAEYTPFHQRMNLANTLIKVQLRSVNSEQELFDIYHTHYSFTATLAQLNVDFDDAAAEELEWLAAQQRIVDQKNAIEAEKLKLEQERLKLELEHRAQRTLITFAANAAATKAQNAHAKALRTNQLAQRKQKIAEDAAKAKQLKREKYKQIVLEHRKVFNDRNNRAKSNFKLHPAKIIKYKDELIALFDHKTKSMKYHAAETLLGKFNGTIVAMHSGSHRTICFNGVLYEYLDIEEASTAQLSPTLVKKGLAGPHISNLENGNLDLLRNAFQAVLPDDWRNLCVPIQDYAKLVLS